MTEDADADGAADQSAAAGRLPFPAVTERPIRLGVLISGGGTTVLNLLQQMEAGLLRADIPLVISSLRQVRGVERCRSAGLRCDVLRPRDFESCDAFSKAVFQAFRNVHVDLIVLAGFLSLLRIPDDFSGRIINIHPSLIPAFCGQGFFGQHVHEAVVARGVKISGCSVHFADNHYDHGPIILQRPVTVPDQATADQLAALVFEQEKIAYPEAIRWLAAGRVRILGRRTVIDSSPDASVRIQPPVPADEASVLTVTERSR